MGNKQCITITKVKKGDKITKQVDSGYINALAEEPGVLIQNSWISIFIPKARLLQFIKSRSQTITIN